MVVRASAVQWEQWEEEDTIVMKLVTFTIMTIVMTLRMTLVTLMMMTLVTRYMPLVSRRDQ